MARSIWNGTITFGLVNVPVKLYSATESKTVHFHEVHLDDGARIEHRRFCPKEEQGGPVQARSSRATRSPTASTSCSTRTRSRPRPATRAQADRRRALRRRRRDRPGLLRQDLLPRRGRRRRGRLPAAARRAGDDRRAPAIGRFTFHNREYLVGRPPARRRARRCTRMRFARRARAGRTTSTCRSPAARPGRARGRDGGQARRVAAREVRAARTTRTATARPCSR